MPHLSIRIITRNVNPCWDAPMASMKVIALSIEQLLPHHCSDHSSWEHVDDKRVALGSDPNDWLLNVNSDIAFYPAGTLHQIAMSMEQELHDLTMQQPLWSLIDRDDGISVSMIITSKDFSIQRRFLHSHCIGGTNVRNVLPLRRKGKKECTVVCIWDSICVCGTTTVRLLVGSKERTIFNFVSTCRKCGGIN